MKSLSNGNKQLSARASYVAHAPFACGRQSGAAVLIILIGMVLAASYFILSSADKSSDNLAMQGDSHAQIQDIRNALKAYVWINKRMPCPDTANSNPTGISPGGYPCSQTEGYVPWVTLGVKKVDSWGRPFRMRLDNAFTVDPIVNTATAVSGLTVRDLNNNPLQASGIAAVIFSCGKNGKADSANDASGNPANPGRCENPGTADTNYTQNSVVENSFDDILVWILDNEITSKLP